MAADTFAFLFFIVGGVLGLVAACVPEAAGRLVPLAVACLAFGLAVQAGLPG